MPNSLRAAGTGIGVEINLFIFHAAPQSFDKHVIPPGTLTIHADINVIVHEDIDKHLAGILT
jgi:hypothetical protein